MNLNSKRSQRNNERHKSPFTCITSFYIITYKSPVTYSPLGSYIAPSRSLCSTAKFISSAFGCFFFVVLQFFAFVHQATMALLSSLALLVTAVWRLHGLASSCDPSSHLDGCGLWVGAVVTEICMASIPLGPLAILNVTNSPTAGCRPLISDMWKKRHVSAPLHLRKPYPFRGLKLTTRPSARQIMIFEAINGMEVFVLLLLAFTNGATKVGKLDSCTSAERAGRLMSILTTRN